MAATHEAPKTPSARVKQLKLLRRALPVCCSSYKPGAARREERAGVDVAQLLRVPRGRLKGDLGHGAAKTLVQQRARGGGQRVALRSKLSLR